MSKKSHYSTKKIYLLLLLVLVANIVSQFLYFRWDTTSNKRYTLSEVSRNITDSLDKPVHVTLFLDGKLPPSFQKIRSEAQQLLEEYHKSNTQINYHFENLTDEENASNETYMKQLFAKGIKPLEVNTTTKGKNTREVVFPWALIQYDGRDALVPLINNTRGMSAEEMVEASVQNLEYALSSAFYKVSVEKSKKIAVINGKGEPSSMAIADALLSLKENYYIAPFVLDSVQNMPQKTLEHLQKFDAIWVNNPNKRFTDKELQVIDQYIIHGGKAFFAVSEVYASMDSLRTQGSFLAFPKDLNLTDLLFKYGVRINPTLVKDEQGAPIKVAVGQQGSQTQYVDAIWKYSPVAFPLIDQPIVHHIEGVKFNFANPIDTLPNNIKKTVLLQSSPFSKSIGVPLSITMKSLGEEVDPMTYKGKGNLPLAVLLEGTFTSMYNNRILPFKQKNYQAKDQSSQIIVVADGTIAQNDWDTNGGVPMELGYDKWTGNTYGNKAFILNSFNYLLGNTELMELRSKNFVLPLLDKEKVFQNYEQIQLLLIATPLLLLVIFGILYTWLRKRKYAK